MNKTLLAVALGLAFTSTHSVWAQTSSPQLPQVDTTEIVKTGEEMLKAQRKASVRPLAPDALPVTAIAKLNELHVNGSLLSQEITDYWMPDLRKPVSSEKMNAFKDWIYAKLEEKGYLGYVDMKESVAADNGSSLTIEVIPIRVGKVTVKAADDKVQKDFVDEIARRFVQRFTPGEILDVADLEAQLDASVYDLPVNLNVSLDPPATGRSQVTINVVNAPQNPGAFVGASLQANNYGLSQYGREQLLGVMRIEGATPLSALTVTSLQSERVGFVRGDYDMPLVSIRSHLRGWISSTHSSTSIGSGLYATNESSELGLGTTTLLRTSRTGLLNLAADLSKHDSHDTSAGIEISKSTDYQLRLKLESQSQHGWFDSYQNEISLIVGNLDLGQNPTDQANDAAAYNRQGNYQKLEMSGNLRKDFGVDWMASVRWRGQLANKNLSGFNRIAIGGMSGIRAYNSADGTGDAGGTLSFDVNRRFGESFYAGLLYDVGVIKLAITPLASNTTTNHYTLQGAGIQMGGKVEKFNWLLSAAKSFGEGQNTTLDSSLTEVGSWRVNFEVTRPF